MVGGGGRRIRWNMTQARRHLNWVLKEKFHRRRKLNKGRISDEGPYQGQSKWVKKHRQEWVTRWKKHLIIL